MNCKKRRELELIEVFFFLNVECQKIKCSNKISFDQFYVCLIGISNMRFDITNDEYHRQLTVNCWRLSFSSPARQQPHIWKLNVPINGHHMKFSFVSEIVIIDFMTYGFAWQLPLTTVTTQFPSDEKKKNKNKRKEQKKKELKQKPFSFGSVSKEHTKTIAIEAHTQPRTHVC